MICKDDDTAPRPSDTPFDIWDQSQAVKRARHTSDYTSDGDCEVPAIIYSRPTARLYRSAKFVHYQLSPNGNGQAPVKGDASIDGIATDGKGQAPTNEDTNTIPGANGHGQVPSITASANRNGRTPRKGNASTNPISDGNVQAPRNATVSINPGANDNINPSANGKGKPHRNVNGNISSSSNSNGKLLRNVDAGNKPSTDGNGQIPRNVNASVKASTVGNGQTRKKARANTDLGAKGNRQAPGKPKTTVNGDSGVQHRRANDTNDIKDHRPGIAKVKNIGHLDGEISENASSKAKMLVSHPGKFPPTHDIGHYLPHPPCPVLQLVLSIGDGVPAECRLHTNWINDISSPNYDARVAAKASSGLSSNFDPGPGPGHDHYFGSRIGLLAAAAATAASEGEGTMGWDKRRSMIVYLFQHPPGIEPSFHYGPRYPTLNVSSWLNAG